MALPVQVEVYEGDNATLVANLTDEDGRQVRELAGRAELDGAGDGRLAVDHDHPLRSTLLGGRFVQVHEGGRTPFAFRIDRDRDVRTPANARESAKTVTVSGDGPLSVLKLGRVLPWLPLNQKPISKRRLFGPASPGLDTSDWTSVLEMARIDTQPARPWGMPSADSRWIWGEAESDLMTVTDCWFRRPFSIASETQISAISSADDQFSDWLHGAELQTVDPPYPAQVWHKPWRSPVLLQPGEYVYAIRGRNNFGKAAVINETWSTDGTGLGDMLFMTGVPDGGDLDFLYGEWLCFMNPAGEWFTPGEIMRILLDECHDRAELQSVVLGFTDTHDSAGNPWPKIEFECDATGTYLDMVELMRATHADVAMSNTGGLVLDAWTKSAGRGVATAISLSNAGGEISADATEHDYEIGNTVLLEGDKAMFGYEDAVSVAANGRLPAGKVSVGSISDPATLDSIGAAYLEPRLTPQDSRVVEVVPMLDFSADPGDTITVEGTSGLRVAEIGFELEPGGRLRKVPALSTPYQEAMKRSERQVAHLVAQAAGDIASTKVLDTGTQVQAGPVEPVEMESWSWTDADGLEPEAWDADGDEPRGWQPFVVKEAARLIGLVVEADWEEPDGAGGADKVTVGDTKIMLLLNGLPTSPFFIATLPETGDADHKARFIQYIFGEGLVRPGDTLTVTCTQNGEHVNGSATIWATDPL